MKIVFTNGCFDIIHKGHIELLKQAKSFGDYLIVGLNSDISIKKLKGENRPFMDESSRKAVLEAIKYVDEVILFDDESVYPTIYKLKPDVLVKGADYKLEDVVGRELVRSYSGEVKLINVVEGYSSTKYINKIS